MSELPKGWVTLSTGDAGVWRGGGTPSKANSEFWTSGTIPWVSPKDMKRSYIAEAIDNITESAIENSATQLIPEGSVLVVTRSGILRHSFPVAANTAPVAINQDLKALTPFDGIEPEYVMLQLQADASEILRECTKSGTTVDSIDFDRLKQRDLRLAPFAEQQRIVEKVDSLTKRTARARKELDRIPNLIARYKRSLLGKMFERLAAEYGTHPLAELTTKIGSGATPRGGSSVYVEQGTPFIRSQNVYFEGFEYEGLAYVDDAAAKALSNVTTEENDVLLNITGASIGRATILPDELAGGRVNQHVSILRCQPNLLNSFLLYFLWSPEMQKLINDENYGVTRQALTKSMIEGFLVPLPPLKKQTEIVRRIESAFGWIDRMASEHASATKLLPKLDGAILAKAFQGGLVPQDPDDEPASVLLAGIEAQRAELTNRPKKSKGERSQGTIVETHAGPMRAEVVRPRQPVKVSAMSKSRRDDDVWQQPYLAKLLKSKRVNDPQALFKFADLPVADFYKQLAWEIGNGHIVDSADELRAA